MHNQNQSGASDTSSRDHPSCCACWLQGHNTRRCAPAVARPNLEIVQIDSTLNSLSTEDVGCLPAQYANIYHIKQDFSRVSAQHPSKHAGHWALLKMFRHVPALCRWKKNLHARHSAVGVR